MGDFRSEAATLFDMLVRIRHELRSVVALDSPERTQDSQRRWEALLGEAERPENPTAKTAIDGATKWLASPPEKRFAVFILLCGMEPGSAFYVLPQDRAHLELVGEPYQRLINLWSESSPGLPELRELPGCYLVRLTQEELEQSQLLGKTLRSRIIAYDPSLDLDKRSHRTSDLAGFMSVLSIPFLMEGDSFSDGFDAGRRKGETELAGAIVLVSPQISFFGEPEASGLPDADALRSILDALDRAFGRDKGPELLASFRDDLLALVTGAESGAADWEGDYDFIVTRSQKMYDIFRLVDKVAKSEGPVLILGESGTGKELIARAIHQNGPRHDRKFVSENCAAIPINLLESEFFGHMKGAFVGANTDKQGLFEVADGGTLFLDEIAELHPELQTKFLRVLQEREIRRVGATDTIKVNVRLISATNKDIDKLVLAREFREDLFYRINVFTIKLPPLRDRPKDIPILARYFLRPAANSAIHPQKTLSQAVLRALVRYDWPGNVRELENEMKRAAAFSSGRHIELDDLSGNICVTRKKGSRQGENKESAKKLGRLVAEGLLTAGGLMTRQTYDDLDTQLSATLSQVLKTVPGPAKYLNCHKGRKTFFCEATRILVNCRKEFDDGDLVVRIFESVAKLMKDNRVFGQQLAVDSVSDFLVEVACHYGDDVVNCREKVGGVLLNYQPEPTRPYGKTRRNKKTGATEKEPNAGAALQTQIANVIKVLEERLGKEELSPVAIVLREESERLEKLRGWPG